MEITQESIQSVVKKIADGYQPEKIIMFGSRAWGTPGPESDVDLLVIKETEERPFDRGVEVRRLLWGSGVPIDILVRTKKEIARRLSFDDPFYRAILDQGKILYER